MEKSPQTPADDITTQRYRGPSALAAGLGEGAVQTKFLLFAGFLVGGIGAFIFHKPAEKNIAWAREGLEKASHSKNGFVKVLAEFGAFPLNIGKHLAEGVTKIGFIKSGLTKLNQQKRVEVAIDGAIFTSAAVSTVGGLVGLGTGAKSAIVGKRQFERAKTEILELRAKNDALQQQLQTTQAELDDAKTTDSAKKGILHVASDEPPPLAVPSSQVAADTVVHQSPMHKKHPHAPKADWAKEVVGQNSAPTEAGLA